VSTRSCQQILDNLNTAVLVLDTELCLISINPAGEILFEVSAKQIVGQRLARILPRSRALIKALREALVSGHPFTERGVHLTLPDSRYVTVDCTVTPLPIDKTDKELLIELNQVDRLLRLTREENMLDKHAANQAVVRGLAHEIKNPLGGLRGAAQLLERELPDQRLKDYTRIIIHEADRLRNLIDRLVGPSRPLTKTPANIHQVFERVRSLILAEIPQGIIIERDYDPSVPEILADSEQLIQAVLNIVRNAVQAAENSGVIHLRSRIERQFTIGQKRHRLVLRAEVEDDGPGIPESLREHVFYPMVTGRAEGTGLGLSIAQTIVNQHGGLIECSSRPKQTIFTIYLPLEREHA
jgi:two-component system, NtrC family, nitrogen regulation sensor histidine kinase GlnL